MYTNILSGNQGLRVTASIEDLDLAKYTRGGALFLTLYISAGVTIGCTAGSLGAIHCTETLDKPSLITIRNYGIIRGCNGLGGTGVYRAKGGDGGAGRDGINLNSVIIVYNYGTIQGGGGGGGAGGANDAAGAGVSAGGGGGSGYPGGEAGPTSGIGSIPGTAGETTQYTTGVGGIGGIIGVSGGNGGDCNGPATFGDNGVSSDFAGGAGGAPGVGVNSNGLGVTVMPGSTTIIGGTI